MIFGGEFLVATESDFISLKTPRRDIAAAIAGVTEDQLRSPYRAIDPEEYGLALTDDDEGYTWELFTGLVEFYKHAAEAGRSVIFSVDQ